MRPSSFTQRSGLAVPRLIPGDSETSLASNVKYVTTEITTWGVHRGFPTEKSISLAGLVSLPALAPGSAKNILEVI